MGTRQFGQDDHDAADDLELYLFNDGWIYEHFLQPVRRALLALIDGGTPYSRKRAVARWRRVADAAAARYAREIGTATYDPRTRGARLLTADALADRFEADLKSGELSYLRVAKARGGKGRAARSPRQQAALTKLGAAIRRARGGYSQEVHDAQDACYDDARIPAAEVDAHEDRVRRGLLGSRNPSTRRTTRAFARQQADLADAILKLTR